MTSYKQQCFNILKIFKFYSGLRLDIKMIHIFEVTNKYFRFIKKVNKIFNKSS